MKINYKINLPVPWIYWGQLTAANGFFYQSTKSEIFLQDTSRYEWGDFKSERVKEDAGHTKICILYRRID